MDPFYSSTKKRGFEGGFNDRNNNLRKRPNASKSPPASELTSEPTSEPIGHGQYSPESFNYFPSSPSRSSSHFPTDFPEAEHTFALPSSPSKEINDDEESQWPSFSQSTLKGGDDFLAPSLMASSSNLREREMVIPSSDDIDYGLDSLNRYRGRRRNSHTLEEQDISAQNTALEKIAFAIEGAENIVSFEYLSLREVPNEISDLRNLISLQPEGTFKSDVKISFAHNKITDINPAMFKVKNTTMLSFRDNRITHIPGKISNLKSLVEFSVGANQITYFPHQILELASLQSFITIPNPLMQPTNDCITFPDDDTPGVRIRRRAVSRFTWLSKYVDVLISQRVQKHLTGNDCHLINDEFEVGLKPPSNAPKLMELCLRRVSNYKISNSEANIWKITLSKSQNKLAAKAVRHGKQGRCCSSCGQHVITPVAEVYEWWDLVNAKNIPIKREFCSGGCAMKWKHEAQEEMR